MNKYAPAGIFPAQRQAFANAIGNETNWYQLLLKVAHLNPEMTGGLLKTFVVDANFLAWGKQEKMRAKYGCNIPWAILLDPTSACNLHCLGCWAADYGHKLNLTFEDIDSIICQGKELGVHVYIYTGGEPLVRKDDVIALCHKHPDCAFLCFTNATLIDEKFCQDMIEVKNFIPAISAEGFEETTDARRGEGTYKCIQHGMDLLRSHALPFGVSTCYTSQNANAVCIEEYLDRPQPRAGTTVRPATMPNMAFNDRREHKLEALTLAQSKGAQRGPWRKPKNSDTPRACKTRGRRRH